MAEEANIKGSELGLEKGALQIYEEALAKGEFILQQCKDCGQHVFYPRVLCNHCGSMDLKWIPATGRGEVYSTSVIRQKPEKGGDYNLALITLEEGPRMMSRVIDLEPEEVKIGMPVNALLSQIDGNPAVVFTTQVEGEEEW